MKGRTVDDIKNRMVHTFQYVDNNSPLNYPDNHFDISYSNRVLCSIGVWDQVLEEMIRVTKPGGKVITTCPDWSSFTSTAFSTTFEAIAKVALEYGIG